VDPRALKRKLGALGRRLSERDRRLAFAAEALAIGRGGIMEVHRGTGMAVGTIRRGIRDLQDRRPFPRGRVRNPGGGRKRLAVKDPSVVTHLLRLVDPATRGDPMSTLLWSAKSVRSLTRALQALGHAISTASTARILRAQGYTLQANQKTKEGTRHQDRDAQFRYINEHATRQIRVHQPVISVDTKKKELIGPFKNAGVEWLPTGKPRHVRVHDFMIPEEGKAVPYGVYDLTTNTGWVSVGVDHDTATFAVHSIASWWKNMGKRRYPNAKTLLITADSGGSNGAKSRLWKLELQRFADRTRLKIHVLHFPPGTSKWNKIEHRMFSFITQNWRARPLTSLTTVVQLIAGTRTVTGLRIRAEIDPGSYPSGTQVTDEQFARIRLSPDEFHGDWNYTITPRPRTRK